MTAQEQRQAVDFLGQRGISQRRSCGLVGIGRSSQRYQPHPRPDDQLGERLQSLAERRQRYGYRRAWAQLRREGFLVNHKRVY